MPALELFARPRRSVHTKAVSPRRIGAAAVLGTVLWGSVFMAPALSAQQPIVLDVAGRSGANPSVTARGDFVVVSWSAASAGTMDVFLAVSRDGGRTFGAPVQVNSVAGQARVSGEMPPRVALVPKTTAGSGGAGAPRRDPDVVVVWTVKQGNDWQLLQARSTDGGAHFPAATSVPGGDAAGTRGWQAVDVDARGRVNVLWLDHRDAAAPMTHLHAAAAPAGGAPATSAAPMAAAPMAKMDPTERAKLSRLYFSTLGGSAKSLTQSVCYCCKTALISAGGQLFAAWRQVYPGSIRDIAFSASRDGGATFTAPVKVSDDQWQIDGCPDNGPTLAVDAKQQVHVLWPTVEQGKSANELSLFYARSTNATTAAAPRFTARRKVPAAGMASHPSLVIGADGAPFAIWDEVVDGQRRLAAATVRGDVFVPVNIPGTGGRFYPAAASVPGGVVLAWVQQGEKGSTIGAVRLTP
jgi:hypothetical protein